MKAHTILSGRDVPHSSPTESRAPGRSAFIERRIGPFLLWGFILGYFLCLIAIAAAVFVYTNRPLEIETEALAYHQIVGPDCGEADDVWACMTFAEVDE